MVHSEAVRRAVALVFLLTFVALVVAMIGRWTDAWDFWRGCVDGDDPSDLCHDVGISMTGRLLMGSLLAPTAALALLGAFWMNAWHVHATGQLRAARRIAR